MTAFDYHTAFSRNIGWVTPAEQDRLRQARVAIAGLGGVGGSHLLTLARLGVGRFHLADFDSFAVENFNRQAGANLATVGRAKLDALCEMALAINPELEIEPFPEGVKVDQAEPFLDGCDLYLDGLDFFALNARRAVFAACERLRIPAITAAPLGMGSALLNFLPNRMSFEDYFQLEGVEEYQQYLRFLVGLAPARVHARYLVLPERIDLIAKRGPSTPMGCELCAGLATTQALKLLLGRGRVLAAPWGQQFDAYENRLHRTWRPGGNRHPLQRLAIRLGERALASQLAAAQSAA
jgi:molybdopterin/thiamine biosynthesis adenylyltransferase